MACDGVVEPVACDLPEVSSSSVVRNPANVLSAIAVAEVRLTDSVRVRFGPVGQPLDSVTSASVASGASVSLPVFGLLERTSYRMQAVAFNGCGATNGKSHEFTTESLPADLPRYTASGADPSPGYVAFAAGSYGIVIDNSGRVVWYHRFANGPGLNFQPQPNGRYAARPKPWVRRTAGGRGRVVSEACAPRSRGAHATPPVSAGSAEYRFPKRNRASHVGLPPFLLRRGGPPDPTDPTAQLTGAQQQQRFTRCGKRRFSGSATSTRDRAGACRFPQAAAPAVWSSNGRRLFTSDVSSCTTGNRCRARAWRETQDKHHP